MTRRWPILAAIVLLTAAGVSVFLRRADPSVPGNPGGSTSSSSSSSRPESSGRPTLPNPAMPGSSVPQASAPSSTGAPSTARQPVPSAATPAPRAGPTVKVSPPKPGIEPAPSVAPALPATLQSSIPSPSDGYVEVDKVNLMLRDYRTLFGQNPVGTNAEIMKSIMGGNPKSANLGPPTGMQLNDNGELVDPWGTAIFFHALSKDHMEIRSAGPDKIMWNSDDVVMK